MQLISPAATCCKPISVDPKLHLGTVSRHPRGKLPVAFSAQGAKEALCQSTLRFSTPTASPNLIVSFRGPALHSGKQLPIARTGGRANAQSSRRPSLLVTSMATPSNQQGPLGVSWPVHLLILAVPSGVAATFFNGSRFGYHPTLLAAGFLFLMAEGILVAIQAKGKQRRPLLQLHMLLQSAAAASISGGMWAIYTNKVLLGKAHFATLHGRVGLLAVLATGLVTLGGLPAMFGLPSALKKKAALVNKAHKALGAVTFLGAMAAVLLGLQVANPAHPLHKGPVTYALGVGTVAITVAVLRSSFALTQAKKTLAVSQPKTVSPSTAQPTTKAE